VFETYNPLVEYLFLIIPYKITTVGSDHPAGLVVGILAQDSTGCRFHANRRNYHQNKKILYKLPSNDNQSLVEGKRANSRNVVYIKYT
jgi:hypothetical protein